jgi:hypothetical protein
MTGYMELNYRFDTILKQELFEDNALDHSVFDNIK